MLQVGASSYNQSIAADTQVPAASAVSSQPAATGASATDKANPTPAPDKASSDQINRNAPASKGQAPGQPPLNETDQAELDSLKARDQEVRSHEQAHQSAAGSYSKGMHLSFEKGADGRRYAVDGEVQIDTSKVAGDPQATLTKAQTILKAALAPAQPSGQDKQVASEARQMITEARAAILAQQQEQLKGTPERAYETAAKPKASLGLDLFA
ncbi:putative metalloprotease CJM1_0395 family protein [Gallaecimonas pentaromativorans]|uniref:putative metalloprotease CJM1_0395 family protein n=1 Tax=Gallaecimonas pentaromativorans TaxID=584787 RepID=UPI003A8E013C